ncbi:cytochrome P450 [Streptomyces sp. MJP52]|uniref:cytochrome P450 n=1 Tax=Streptomyces sp. MJP52 TaxID=2940555 RepID=UPI0024743B3E|nr:cytochrome P450 [Streptomyces sp. MJP52]MDH6226009.1 cytochrome P450 [Streptomyces sp. MJP52]
MTVLTEHPAPGGAPAGGPGRPAAPPEPVGRPELLVDPALHATGDLHGIWRWMREHAPVHRHEEGDLPAFWSLTRYEDIRAVYRDPATFSSAHGVLLRPLALGEDPGAGQTLALTDPPRHKQLRGLMADWFSTRAVRGLEDFVRDAVRDALARAVERGTCDAVHDVAARISLYTIARIIGVPREDQEALFRWTDEAFLAHRSLAAHHGFMGYFIDLMDRRAAEPADDLLSSLVHGTVDGEPLTEEEILLNCENLVGATENGRLALAAGLLALLEHPAELARLRADRALLPAAGEEILRWTSSATHSMRTATRPVEIRGRRIEAGDRVVVWVPSGNRDEDVFPDPYRFDVGRTPNRHLALAAGEHFCIGSTLARAQLRLLLTEVLDTGIGLEPSGPAVRLRSIHVAGPESIPLRVTPPRRPRPAA